MKRHRRTIFCWSQLSKLFAASTATVKGEEEVIKERQFSMDGDAGDAEAVGHIEGRNGTAIRTAGVRCERGDFG